MKKDESILSPSHLAAYSDLFDRLLDCSILVDFDTNRIIDANPACERLFETSREELLKRNFLDLSDPSQSAFIEKRIRMAKRRYYPHQFESEWIVKSETRKLMQISACPLRLSNETEALQVIAKDITEQRALEKQAESYLKELQELNKKLEDLSVTDEMTKLANFRHFKNLLKQEHERAKRYGISYTIIFCDVDHFKHYNDRNGHPAGDDVLRGVAEILRKNSRTVDVAARYGGEEFVVLCPQTTHESAFSLAERIRSSIEKHPFLHAESQPLGKVSISIGLASFPFDGLNPEDVLKAADNALYYSKKNGRNQITMSDQISKDKPKAA